jgi:hypothetical protein
MTITVVCLIQVDNKTTCGMEWGEQCGVLEKSLTAKRQSLVKPFTLTTPFKFPFSSIPRIANIDAR